MPPPTKNVLLVGGEPGGLVEGLTKKLAKFNLDLTTHWPCSQKNAKAIKDAIPVGIDIILVMTDVMSHVHWTRLINAQRTSTALLVPTTRRWADIYQSLVKYKVLHLWDIK